MKIFLDFEKMITPTVIKVIYFLGIAGVLIGGAFNLVSSLVKGNIGGIIMGLLMMILGPIMVRVYAEFLVLGFKILEALKK